MLLLRGAVTFGAVTGKNNTQLYYETVFSQ